MDPETAYARVGVGSLLIAGPYGQDAWFGRSVIWIASHGESGTFGFMVNKQLGLSLGEMINDFPSGGYMPYLGGPVRTQTLNYIHRLGDGVLPGAFPVSDGVFWGGDYDILRQMIEAGELYPEGVKFFLGSSGWDAGQLREEFLRGDWGVVSGVGVELLGHTHNLWYELVEASPEYAHWGLVPEDPADN